MQTRNLGVAFAAMLLAGGLALAATGASAESAYKQCDAQWKAAKAAGTTNGQTWKDFYATCKAAAAATPAAAPAPAMTPAAAPAPAMTPAAAPAPAMTPAAAPAPAMTPAAAMTPKPKKTTTPMAAPVAATGAGQFAAEAEAKAHCPTDTVVWANTSSKSHKYHYAGNKSYGTTKHGAYMCEADAKAAGFVAAKDETPK